MARTRTAAAVAARVETFLQTGRTRQFSMVCPICDHTRHWEPAAARMCSYCLREFNLVMASDAVRRVLS